MIIVRERRYKKKIPDSAAITTKPGTNVQQYQ